MSEKSLTTNEEHTVEFYGDEIKGVTVMVTPSERVINVPIRPLCDYLGMQEEA